MQSKCIDIMELNEFPEYDILWTDPPWGQKMVSFFESQLVKQGFEKPGHNIYLLLDKLASLADKKPIFIQYSLREDFVEVIKIFNNKGHWLGSIVPFAQTNSKPAVLLCFNTHISYPQGLKGKEIILHMISELSPKIIFDPFAGIGHSAKFILQSGVKYTGYEINPLRFNKLQTVLSKYEKNIQ